MRKVVVLKIFVIMSIMINFTSQSLSYADQFITPETNWEKVKQIIKSISESGITLDYRCRDSDYVERNGRDNCGIVESLNMTTGYFLFKDRFNEFNRLHIADINNDGQEDYIFDMKAGSGEFLDIEAIITRREGQLVDIYDEIKLELTKFINGEDPDCSWCDELDMYHGDLVFEKHGDGKIYFSLVGPSGSWYDLQDDLETTKKVTINDPTFYTFLWDNAGFQKISEEQRQYTKKADHDSQMIQEVDKWLLEGGLNELLAEKSTKKNEE